MTRKKPPRKKPPRRPADTDDVAVAWINSEVMPDGSYRPSIAFTDDRAVTLDETAAVRYALAVLDAAHRAEYDAAVLAQMSGTLGVDETMTATLIATEVRPLRRPQRDTGTPLSLTPGVSQRTRRGFLTVALDGKPVGQWDVAAAREHAHAILDALLAADLDAAYHRALVELVGIDDARARQAVADVANHREGGAG